MEKCDLIHLHSWFPPCDNLYTLKFFRNLKTPFICSLATTIWDYYRLYCRKRPYLRMIKWFIYSRLVRPKTIIVWSQKARSSAIKQFAYNPGKIEVAPPFIKPQLDRKNRDDSSITVGFIGNDFERKGGFLLLEAFNALSGKYGNLRLNVVSNYKINSTEFIKSYGRQTRDALFSWFYPDCDIFVLPTRADFFGMAILEAMSFGIPVITSDVYAMKEIIDDGKDGFLIPPGDPEALLEKMSILIENKSLREKIGKQAKNKISERFSPEVIGERLKQIYKKCLCASG
jgi:glycosyltransferase involved in cell wall biosynthesis